MRFKNFFAFPKGILWVIQYVYNIIILYTESSASISEPADLTSAYFILYLKTISFVFFENILLYFEFIRCYSVGWLAFWYTLFFDLHIYAVVDFSLPCDITECRAGKKYTQLTPLSHCEVTQYTKQPYSRMKIILWQFKSKMGVRESFSAWRICLLNNARCNDTGQKPSNSK